MRPETVELAHAGGSVRVVQLTDCHLEEAQGGQLLGLDTDDSLAHVLALLRADPNPAALLLATGDLANHGSRAAYLRLRGRLDRCGMPWFWLPGNHDEFPAMEAALGRGAPMVRAIRIGAWQIVLLDSTIPGEVGGELGAAELARLDRLLGAAPERHALVCLHHQPVPIGCAWLDEQMVCDAEAFFAVLARHPQVRGVVWGHVHQEFRGERDGVLLLATPSTCIQFAPGREDFGLDERAPGLRWLELQPDGRIDTGVTRVEGVRFSFDRNSAGYL